MDIEKTLELIAASQLQAEKQAKARAREFDERHAQAMKRMDRADKQIAATRDLVRAGMKMVVSIQKAQKETGYKLDALIDSQMRTDARILKLEERMAKSDERFEERMAKFEARMAKSDERFDRLLAKIFGKRTNGHN